jgi:amino acid transporter
MPSEQQNKYTPTPACDDTPPGEITLLPPVKTRLLGVNAVILILFFNVSGGPLGAEQIISSVGPAVGLLGLLIFPLVWGVPSALVTAELSTAFAENGGYSIWVTSAFGRFWGVQESYWSWVSGVVDNAIYPVLVFNTAQALFNGAGLAAGASDDDDVYDPFSAWRNCDHIMSCVGAYLAKVGIMLIFAIPNLYSLKHLERGLLWGSIFLMAPFLLLSIMAIPKADVSFWVQSKSYADMDLDLFLSVLYWNFSGFDCVSTFAGEVENPGKAYPRALFLSMPLLVLTYLIPLSMASAVPSTHWENWSDGDFSLIAKEIGGSWLGMWIVVSTIIGSWGLFVSELLEDSYQLLGMAEMGLVSKVFAKRHPVHDTPWHAIVFQLLIIGVLVAFNFNAIIAIDNFFSVISSLLEFAAAVKLRHSRPDMLRPYKAPFSDVGLLVFLLMPSLLGLYIIWLQLSGGSIFSIIIIAVALAIGPMLAYCAGDLEESVNLVATNSTPGGHTPRFTGAAESVVDGDVAVPRSRPRPISSERSVRHSIDGAMEMMGGGAHTHEAGAAARFPASI